MMDFSPGRGPGPLARSALRGCCYALSVASLMIGAGAAAAAPAGPHSAGRERTIERPRRDSLEYRLSLGLPAIRADGAYARGATGRGVIVAMIDTGVSATSGLFSQLSPHSIDLVEERTGEGGDARHGEQTASLLGGALDGAGILGVAYDATLLSVRADIDQSCLVQCAVRGVDLARGIDYALAQGARVIGVPLVGPKRLPSVEGALARAAAQGAVIVAAAGNDGGEQPAWPARYAADPRFANAMIVAGAATWKGGYADWSSRAAAAGARYIVAPGENIPVDCGTEQCSLVSGTSYSVSFVAGALSLIMSRYPQLSAQQAAVILLDSATPVRTKDARARARAGTGRGRLDVSRAMRTAERAAGRSASTKTP